LFLHSYYYTNISIENLSGLSRVGGMIEPYTIDFLKTKSIKELPQVQSSLEEAGSIY